MAKHKLYETGDEDAPSFILNRNGEVVLALCRVCGGGEASLPIECPGKRMSELEQAAVARGNREFMRNKWWRPVGGE